MLDPDGGQKTFSCGSLGRVTTLTLGNGAYTTYAYP
jgi:hypothetical protein